MVRRSLGIAVVALTALLHTAAATQQDEISWKNLNQLTHRATFIFVTNTRDCVAGSLKSSNSHSFTVRVRDKSTRTLQRDDLLRVSRGAWAPGVLFSGRSSWLDVVALKSKTLPQLPIRVQVTTKAGQEHEGNLIRVSDEDLTLQTDNHELKLPKANISTVSYLVPKPLSDSAMYADEELVFLKIFDPELWPVMFGTQPKLNVPLFDASVPEDNSQVICRDNPWGLKDNPAVNLTKP